MSHRPAKNNKIQVKGKVSSLDEEQRRTKLSKKLSATLRHKAIEKGLRMRPDGCVAMRELLAHPDFHRHSLPEVMEVVQLSDKKRFEIKEENSELYIRACQGHTIDMIVDELLLTEITSPTDIPVCIHGTKAVNLPPIVQTGLNRMNRNHIHFATGLPGEMGVISGMRYSCEVAIYVDVFKAMADGVRFFRSSNNVILSKGIHDSGVLPSEYFLEITNLR